MRRTTTLQHACNAVFTSENLEGRCLLAAAATAFPAQTPVLPDDTVLFVNYDNGGEGVAFHDVDRRNQGGEYRRKDAVDIEWNSDTLAQNTGDAPGLGRAVGHTRAGEWLQYEVNVDTAATYQFDLRYAAGGSGGTAHLEIDGKDVTGTLSLDSTGDWQRWQTLQKSGVDLTPGSHTMRFVLDGGNGDIANLHWFRFSPVASAAADLPWPTTWTQIGDAPAPRFESMSHLMNGNLYVFGGYKDSAFRVDRSYEIYNPTTDRWKTLGNLPVGMAESHITPVDDGKFIYFVGGFAGDLKHDGVGPTQVASDRVWRFNPADNTWRELPRLPQPQGAGGAAIVGDKLHFMGGNFADRVTNVSEHYVLDLSDVSEDWTAARSMPDAKDHFSTVVLSGKIYTLGGEHGHDKFFDTQSSVYVYDPKKDKWKRLADMPLPDSHAEGSTFAYDGQIVFAGGQTLNQTSTNRVLAYDPASDRWRDLDALPGPLQGTSVNVLDDGSVLITMGARYTVQPLSGTYIGVL